MVYGDVDKHPEKGRYLQCADIVIIIIWLHTHLFKMHFQSFNAILW